MHGRGRGHRTSRWSSVGASSVGQGTGSSSEQVSRSWDDEVRQAQARLFNASTVLTLFIGVSCAYVGLIAINLFAASLVIAPDVLGEYLQQPARVIDYAKLTWLATSGAAIAGALGTGFESEESVRQAAYSRREQQRRAQLDEEQDMAIDPSDAGPSR